MMTIALLTTTIIFAYEWLKASYELFALFYYMEKRGIKPPKDEIKEHGKQFMKSVVNNIFGKK